MANRNPWRDIFSPAEWGEVKTNATAPRPKVAGAPQSAGGATGTAVAAGPGGTAIKTPYSALQDIELQILQYDAIPKDDYTRFDERIAVLNAIHGLCDVYVQLLQREHHLSAKSPGGKQLTDGIDVWVHTLGSRSLKKAGYLAEMKKWHQNAKPKYKDKTKLSIFLRGLAADNTRNFGEKLHTTPYATVEKIDPYHRQTSMYLDPLDATRDRGDNLMGTAFLDYLDGVDYTGTPNPNASFYEWLEYHPLCRGTPGVTPGAEDYKDPPFISHSTGQHDLGYVYLPARMEYERILSAPGVRHPLNTTDFGASRKGPPGAVAFVWSADADLWIHQHGLDGFVHASAMHGKKIRCSGMLVAKDGLATAITNESGHYAPTAESIYYFAQWLNARRCLSPASHIKIEHDKVLRDGEYTYANFLAWGAGKFVAPTLPYSE